MIDKDSQKDKIESFISTAPHPAPFPGAKLFFYVKLGNIKVLHVNNMRDYSLFIEQDLSDKMYLALSEFVVLAVK